MPKAPEWLSGDIQEFYPICQGNIRAIQHSIRDRRGIEIAYMTISDRLKRLGLERPRAKGKAPPTDAPTHPTPDRSAPTPPDPVPDPVMDEALSAIADILPAIAGPTDALSPAETDALARCERIIAEGIQTFVEVGRALLVIRDGQLYRQTHATFEAYCRERWDLSRTYAYQLIGASEVVDEVAAVSDVVPANEAQARPLASLPPEQRVEAWREAVDTAPERKITAKHVQATVKRLRDTTAASRRQQEKPPPDRARQAAEWQDRFSHQFRDFERLLERFKQAGGVLTLVRDWDVDEQRRFLQDLRAQAKTLLEMAAHFEKVILGEEAALQALARSGDSPTPVSPRYDT
jgi:hypothetical protein